ncbi:septum formation family protein [Sanguibacter sp. A247]|uniref:septum formation family protein n=1 Tax=unclassified Sanguibacter TaxID=2645534 RepID=UPI003FD8E546
MRRPATAWRAAGACAVLACALAGCTSDDDEAPHVTDVVVGDCLRAPAEVSGEVETVTRVACSDPHEQEAYASVPVVDESGAEIDTFPGDAWLKSFSDGACASEFEGYVGVDYRDSDLFFTYLQPNARGWEDGDRSVLCLVTTTGAQLTASVRGGTS